MNMRDKAARSPSLSLPQIEPIQLGIKGGELSQSVFSEQQVS